ncbi:uncharacterized protein VTP21DRAFT_1343 [Calcarisporiella thermophila]|uniref:uncharacterized protein n=1 Tax=Calcarisporiella thermophila TaxID=911321 RepID=UPI003744B085
MAEQQDDLVPTMTEGYRVGEKKTLEEYHNLDAGDESLRKWKESLGLKAGAGNAAPPDDPRKVVVLQLAMEVDGRDDVVLDLSSKDALEKTKTTVITIKEGIHYRFKIKFKIQHDVVSGLKYLQVVKKMGVRVDKEENMLGSYGPSAEPYEKKFPEEEAPSGMLARGRYEVKSKFVDDDGIVHLEWQWAFKISKDWE